jgi:hypothetical protein
VAAAATILRMGDSLIADITFMTICKHAVSSYEWHSTTTSSFIANDLQTICVAPYELHIHAILGLMPERRIRLGQGRVIVDHTALTTRTKLRAGTKASMRLSNEWWENCEVSAYVYGT